MPVRGTISMWKSTRMIVLVAVVAAVYATAQITLNPFSLVLIPAVLEFKMANVLTMLLGVLFGPAGAWGVAIGNAVGDLFTGNLALGSVFGFFSSFSVAYVGYTLWRRFRPESREADRPLPDLSAVVIYLAIGLVAATVAAVVLAWGLNLLGIAPFRLVSNTLVANFAVGSWIGAVLYSLVANRLTAMGLTWTEILEPVDSGWPAHAMLGALLVTVGGFGGWLLGAFVLPEASITPVVGFFFACIVAGCLLL
jgi:energy-coupling factor transport system substrate-specific component